MKLGKEKQQSTRGYAIYAKHAGRPDELLGAHRDTTKTLAISHFFFVHSSECIEKSVTIRDMDAIWISREQYQILTGCSDENLPTSEPRKVKALLTERFREWKAKKDQAKPWPSKSQAAREHAGQMFMRY